MQEEIDKKCKKSGTAFSDEQSLLEDEIRASVQEYAEEMQVQKVKSLSRYDPEKVAKILYLFSTGSSQTRIIRKYGYSRGTVVNILVEFADHIKKFKELGGKLAARNYLDMSSLEEDLIEKVRDRMEQDPEFEVSFRDLKELSIAKANTAREALTARGEVSNITEERKVHSQEDYENMLELARKRIKDAKKAEGAEVIDLEE